MKATAILLLIIFTQFYVFEAKQNFVKPSVSFLKKADNHAVDLISQTATTVPLSEQCSKVTTNVPGKQSKISFTTRFLGMFLPWLYFMCTSMNIPTLPKYVNWAINKGSTAVTPLSAKVYGNINGLDAFFTFLSVNFVGCLSDRYGRKPFMILSALGLGLAYSISSVAKTPWLFYLGSTIDGLTSCMLSQSQSYNADINRDNANLSMALSKFQGIAIGLSFMLGIPLGSILGSKFSYRAPLKVSVGICLVNALLIALFLPPSRPTSSATPSLNETDPSTSNNSLKSFNWKQANPFGAVLMFRRSQKLLFGCLTYLLIQIAQSGVIVNWINYLQYRFGWSAEVSGATLMIVGLVVGIVPQIIVPRLGTIKSIKVALSIYTAAAIFLGSASSTWKVFFGMFGLAIGASCLLMILGFLTEQVSAEEVGALQGAADTLRTIASTIGSPFFARVFAYCIEDNRNIPGGSLYLVSIFSLLALAVFHKI